MSWVSLLCFGICLGIVLSCFRREADILSPGRVFGFVWSLAIGLADLKLSRVQQTWSLEGWALLLIGISSFLVGTSIAFVLSLGKKLVPISVMRRLLRQEEVVEQRLFWFIVVGVGLYTVSYLVIFLAKGWLPVFVVGTKLSRVDFYVFGFGVLINSTAFIVFLTVVYLLLVNERRAEKIFLTSITLIALGSYFLLLQRFQIIMAAIVCFTLLYYATSYIKPRIVLFMFLGVTVLFYWISTLRFRYLELLSLYLYSTSGMRFSATYAFLTEPYMYLVMNLENFVRAVNLLDHHTYGYFTFDFLVSATGLEKWLGQYFAINRMPYLNSGYNTYSAFWVFYRDFGAAGLALIPFVLGLSISLLYYRMRSNPTIKNVTAYGVMAFVMFISFFVFPISFLWFLYNMLALYWGLRWALRPRKSYVQSGPIAEQH
ncbi:MAG: O-antigen polymerase [Bacteroidota bacterium]